MKLPIYEMLLLSLIMISLHVGQACGWSWSCLNGDCVRGDVPDNPRLDETLAVCRLTCGKYGALWPQPTGPTSISGPVILLNLARINFNYSAVAGYDQTPVKDLVTSICHLFVENLRRTCEANCSEDATTTLKIHFTITSPDLKLSWDTDESYSLLVTAQDNEVAVHIGAKTLYGARHGLETVSQLIGTSEDQLVIVTAASISDRPVYPHRGLLLDTGRNYLTLNAIKRTIDAMSTCKLNVLHWHVTDSQSFPLVLPRVPELARYGAYSAEEVYTVDDVAQLVKYGREKGVHIMMELDGPAHAGNGWQWGPEHGLGSLAVCVNSKPWRNLCLQPPCGQLNPANPNLYRVLRNVFRDLLDRLPPGEIFHMGGDEVFIPCWNQSQEVTDWMKARGMTLSVMDFLNVWGEYHQKVLQAWDSEVGHSQTTVVLWTSHMTGPGIINDYLNKDRYVIEAWTDTDDPTPEQLMRMGYRVIFATRDAWYLDHGFWGRTQYHKWREAYDNRLPDSAGVLGGEAAMWGELVDDSNLDTRTWPRAAAVAERLWSNPKTSNYVAENRMFEFRRRLTKRGITPETLGPGWCTQNEGGCSGSQNL